MGLQLVTLTLVLLTQLVQGSQVVGTYNLMLDPGRIYWWKTKWMANPIDISKSNAGSSGVTITFNFNPSTSITNGIFEVTFPSTGFTLTGMTSSLGYSVSTSVVQKTGVTYISGQDTSIQFGPITLPTSAGGVGPFALRSRYFPKGQVVDCNLSFGAIYITATEGTLGTPVVTYVPNASSNVVNQPGNQLSFKFTIAKDMWKYDMFKITTNAYFTVVMSSGYMCTVANTGGFINNFNGTRAASPNFLDCVASAATATSTSQTVWIYGMVTDVVETLVTGNTYVELRVPGFTNPATAMDSASVTWIIETVRFGTTNTLESVKATGPAVVAGTIRSATWRSTWGLTTFISGFQLYMDIIIVISNPVPSGGNIVVTFTESTAVGATFAIVSNIGVGTTGVATSSSLTVSGFDSLAAGATIVLRYVANLTPSATNKAMTLAIVTTAGGTPKIDSSSGLCSTLVSTTSTSIGLTASFKEFAGAATSNARAGGTGDATQFLNLAFTGSTLATSSVKISCPLFSAIDDFQAYIPDTNPVVQVSTAAINQNTDGTTITTTVTKVVGSMTMSTAGIPVYTPGTVSFTNSVGTTATTIAVSSATVLSLPLVVSNVMTAYECRVEAGTSLGVSIFLVNGQSLQSSALTYFCLMSVLDGTPVRVTFQPLVVSLFSSTAAKTYYLEITFPVATFPSYHNSNAGSGDQYPMDSNLSTGATMNIFQDATYIYHRVAGLGTINTSSSAVQIFFPVGGIATGSVTINYQINTYYTLAAENRTTKTKYYTHQTGALSYAAGTTTDSTALIGASIPSITSGGSFVTGTTTTSASPLTISIATGLSITSSSAYFYIILPTGFAFSALKDVQSSYPTAGSSFPEKRFFSSYKRTFKFPGVLVGQSNTGTQLSSTATTLSIFGLIAPLGQLTSTPAQLVIGDTAGSLAVACPAKSVADLNMSVSTGSITTLVVSPSTVQGRGPKGVDINQTIQMTLPHGIEQGGSIVFMIASDWGWSSTLSQCTVSNLNSAPSQTLSCTPQGQTFTISKFAGFEKVTNQSITIYLTRLLPPTTTDQNGSYQFVTSCKTTTSTVELDVCTTFTKTIVTVLSVITVGQSTFQAINFFPPHAGGIETDMYIRFTLPFDLPIDSLITVTVPYSPITTTTTLANENKCWMSPLTYKTCAISSSVITLSLGQAYTALTALELFVRRSFVTPTDVPTTASGTLYGFKVGATWGDGGAGIVISDPTITSSTGSSSTGSSTATSSIYASSYGTRLVIPASKVTTTITSASTPLYFNPRNAGETSYFTISFKVSAAFAVGDYLHIIWPDEFDAYIGDAIELLTQDPGNFYIPCSSNQLGTPVWCYVDHWVMVVKGTQAVPSGSQIDITVQNVHNPVETTTGSFRVMHYNVNNTLIEYNSNLGTVAVVPVPGFLEVRALNSTNSFLEKQGDYSLYVYGITSIDSSTSLKIQFPKEYDLSLVDQKDSYTCATQYMDRTFTATSIKVPQEWNTGASCTQANNMVTMSTSSTSAKTFPQPGYITWNITSVLNPVWAYPRLTTSLTQDFDIQDWDVWTISSYWTSKFLVFTYTTASSTPKYLQRSYHHATGAYLGFMTKYRSVIVNGYNPLDKSNRIVVWPGTQTTDLQITTANATWPMEAKMLTLTPSTNTRTPDNSALLYTSNTHDFILLQEEWKINFRVAASIDAIKGLYYVDWKLDETLQPGVTGNLYVPPTPTLLEIAPKVFGRYWFSVSTVPAVSVGASSVPIGVSITNAPHADVTIQIAVQNVDSVGPNPTSLTFKPDVNQLFFYLNVNATHDVSIYPSVVVVFSLTGTDADAFAIQPAIVVPIQSKSLYSTGNIAKIGIANIARTSVTIAPTTDQLGVLYYILQPMGSAILSFSDLKALVPTFIKTDADFATVTNNNVQTRTSFQSDPQTGETWFNFQVREYLSHVTTFRSYGAIPMVTTVTTTPIQITGLYADTSYQVLTYFDNFNTNATSVASRIEYFDTLTTHDCQPVYVRFQYTVDTAYGDGIYNTLCKYLGINPVRLVDRNYNQEKASTRELQGATTTTSSGSVTNSSSPAAFTVFSGTILPNRAIETPTPTLIATLSNEAVDRMQQDFIAAGISNQMWNYGPLAIPTRVQPMWDRVPQIQSFSNTTITPEFLSTTAGKSCCVALLDTNANLKPEQILRLYDYNWTQAIGTCIDTDITLSINSLTLTGLQPDTNYYVHCIATDTYPLWPTQMTYTSTFPVPFIPIHTPIDLEIHYELSQASGLQFFFLGLLALLLH